MFGASNMSAAVRSEGHSTRAVSCGLQFRSSRGLFLLQDTFRGRVCECPVVNGVLFSGDGYTHCARKSRTTPFKGVSWTPEAQNAALMFNRAFSPVAASLCVLTQLAHGARVHLL